MKQLLRYSLLAILLMCVESQASYAPVYAAQSDVSELGFTYVRFIEEERIDVAIALLENNQEELEQFSEKNLPTELQSDFQQLVQNNLDVLRSSDTRYNQKYQFGLSLAIAIDAINDSHGSSLQNWKNELSNDLSALVDDKSSQNSSQLKEVTFAWNVISPALKFTINPEEYAKLSSTYYYLGNSDEQTTDKWVAQAFTQINLLKEPKNSSSEKENMTLILIIAIVGGCITLTLTYVGWKKYRAEKNKNYRKDANS